MKQSVLAMELDAVACNNFGMQEWMADLVDETLGPRQKEPPSGPPPGPPLAVFAPGHIILNICSPLWEILVRRFDKLLARPSKSLLNGFRHAGK
jgi:hypothetical protein